MGSYKSLYRDGTGDGCHHDADGGLGGEERGAAGGDGRPRGADLGPFDLGVAGQGRVELLLLLLLLDLSLQLLLGVHRGRGQGLHLGLERVGLGGGHEGRGRGRLQAWRERGTRFFLFYLCWSPFALQFFCIPSFSELF